ALRIAVERKRPYSPNGQLVLTGGVMLGITYVSSVLIAAQRDLDPDKRLYFPIAGPWIDLGQRPCSFGSTCTQGDNVGSAALVTSGILQAAGTLLVLASLAIP